MDSLSIESTVGTALSLKDANVRQDIQMTMLRKVLDNQAQSALSLVESIPQLATSGSVGTKLHAIA